MEMEAIVKKEERELRKYNVPVNIINILSSFRFHARP